MTNEIAASDVISSSLDIFSLLIAKKWNEVSSLIKDDKKVAKLRDASNNLPIHVALASSAPRGTILELLDAYPEAARSPSKNGLLPIHYAAAGRSSKTVQAIQACNRDGAQAKDAEGNLPLHYAAYCGATPDVFVELLSEYKEGSRVRNNEGNVPVQVLLMSEEYSHECMNKLLDASWQVAGGTL